MLKHFSCYCGVVRVNHTQAFLLQASFACQSPTSNVFSKAPDDQIVTIRAIKTEDVHERLSFCRVNKLTNTQHRAASGNRQKFRSSCIGGHGINFLIRMTERDVVLALQSLEEGFSR